MSSKKKILIVDDEPNVVTTLSTRLRANNYEVIAAFDAMQAVRQAHRENPDLIILDIRMPGGGGYTAFERIKLSADTALIPIIFLSALPPAEVKRKAKELGADDFIPKPFESEVLLGKIKKLLGEEVK